MDISTVFNLIALFLFICVINFVISLYARKIRRRLDGKAYWEDLIKEPMLFQVVGGTSVYGLIDKITEGYYHLVGWSMYIEDEESGESKREHGEGVLTLPENKVLFMQRPTYDNDSAER